MWSGHTALNFATENKSSEVVKYLVDNGVEIQNEFKSALIDACFNGDFDMVNFFIKQGGDVNARDVCNRTAIIWASYMGHFEMVKYLLEIGAVFDSTDRSQALILASEQKNNLEMVKHLVENGADVNATDDDGYTALMCASLCGLFEVVEYLVGKSADVNATDKYGNTALIHACLFGFLDT